MKMNPQKIKISDYDYPLTDDRIAKFPLARRDASKLLLYRHGEIGEDVFCHLPEYIPKGSLMVFNNTRVIRARLLFRKATGALIEVFLLEPFLPADYERVFQTTDCCEWLCMVGNLKKWKEGRLERVLKVKGQEVTLTAERLGEHHTSQQVRFTWTGGCSFADVIEAAGQLPIPPYLNRDTCESDLTTYQTVYSKIKGSVAAPTAGLHFTDEVLAQLDACGVEREEITLHVGAGTFKPVKSEEIAGHEMHTEYISVHRSTLQRLIDHGAQAVAVGTTSVRTLESLYYMGLRLQQHPELTEQELHIDQWEPYSTEEEIPPVQALQNLVDWLDRNGLSTLNSSTQIIIAPGYEYKIVKMLITNFHQPKSTLLLLVGALVGERWRDIYRYALDHDFRFLSYGDSSLLIP